MFTYYVDFVYIVYKEPYNGIVYNFFWMTVFVKIINIK